jgi:hypothetical protein
MYSQEQNNGRHYARQESIPFSTSPASLFASTGSLTETSCSASSSESSWSPHFSSSSASPASSLASSPALHPSKPHSPVSDDFELGAAWESDQDRAPSPTQLTAYAASIIRNEAYALLALAARIAPAAQPVVDDGRCSADDAEAFRRAIGSPGTESKTNMAFRGVVDALNSLPAHGKIIVTGVGKSGIAGRKMVATFCSLGELRVIEILKCMLTDMTSAPRHPLHLPTPS